MISLVPEDTIENVSVAQLAKDETLGAETAITIVREVEQIETAVAEQLVAESGGDLDTQLRVLVKYDDAEATPSGAMRSRTMRSRTSPRRVTPNRAMSDKPSPNRTP